jgi:hypothetical protein
VNAQRLPYHRTGIDARVQRDATGELDGLDGISELFT